MNMKFEKTAQALFNSPGGSKLSEKKGDIEKIANSADGQKLKAMLDGRGDIKSALENGDVDAMRGALSDILNTDEGARIFQKLGDIMK